MNLALLRKDSMLFMMSSPLFAGLQHKDPNKILLCRATDNRDLRVWSGNPRRGSQGFRRPAWTLLTRRMSESCHSLKNVTEGAPVGYWGRRKPKGT